MKYIDSLSINKKIKKKKSLYFSKIAYAKIHEIDFFTIINTEKEQGLD